MKTLLITVGLLCAGNLTQGATIIYTANLSGAAESPANASPGTGFVTATLDDVLNTIRIVASFSGLSGNTTAAHIHASTAVPGTGTAGVATTTPSFVGFPLGVTSGSMDQTYDMTLASSYNAAFITANGGTTSAAFTALKSALNAGTSYFNIHTAAFAGGEIRGFLTAVPEPSTVALSGMLGGLLAFARRRR